MWGSTRVFILHIWSCSRGEGPRIPPGWAPDFHGCFHQTDWTVVVERLLEVVCWRHSYNSPSTHRSSSCCDLTLTWIRVSWRATTDGFWCSGLHCFSQQFCKMSKRVNALGPVFAVIHSLLGSVIPDQWSADRWWVIDQFSSVALGMFYTWGAHMSLTPELSSLHLICHVSVGWSSKP